MRRESLVNIVFCAVFLTLAIIIFGYLKSTKAKLEKEAEEVKTSVLRTFLAERGDFVAQFRTFGTVQVVNKLNIKSEVAGRVLKIHPAFFIGGEILANESILTIDKTDLRLSVQQAEANLELSTAQYKTIQQEARNIEASLKLQRESYKLSQNELKRQEQMYAEKTISRQTLENFQKVKQAKQLEVLNLENQFKLVPSRLLQAESTIKLNRVRFTEAKNRLKKAEIIAPFRGRVTSKNISVGEYLNIGSKVGELIDLDALEIHTPIPNSELPWLTNEVSDSKYLSTGPVGIKDKAVKLEFLAPDSASILGTVQRLGASLDNATRSLMAYIQFNKRILSDDSQKQEELHKILPGSFCRVNFAGKTLRDVLKVPRSSLKLSQIQVVRKNKLHFIPVDIVRDEGEKVYIRADVATNEQIVAYFSERNSPKETVQTKLIKNI